MAAATYSGFAGMLSLGAKGMFDAAYKNTPQGMAFPLDEMTTDLAKTVSQVITAAANDPHFNWFHAAQEVSKHILTQNFQLGRTIWNQGINNGLITGYPADIKLLSDKLGELRRFNMVTGRPYDEGGMESNPYMNMEQKRFKMEQDPMKALQQAAPMINTIIQVYGNKPDIMMQKLKALKQNSYATMPSMENTPLSFMEYIRYLGHLKGPQAAQDALMDYMKHKMINEVKSSMVP
jgi:hypothetical protein